jgi:hypothetical protein
MSRTTEPSTALSGRATSPLLADYPHVAGCADCRRYAADRLGLTATQALVVATLAHHDSAHATDPLTLASQHFA